MSNKYDFMYASPFCLDEGSAKWVLDTLECMDDDEKIRQLFCLITYNDDEEYCKYIGKEVRPGGFMCRVMKSSEARNAIDLMQKYSKIPLLVCANLESGGIGVASDATPFASNMAIGATADPKYARILGEVCGQEGKAIGVNFAFAPVCDIDFNFRNPITNTRTFSSDKSLVARMSEAYIKEIQKHGLCACAKHFPGDGYDERDQHIAPSINGLEYGEWKKTYGEVYKNCIKAGVKSVMIGHIISPSCTVEGAKELNEKYEEKDLYLPATVNKYIVNGILKKHLGFNGLVITDSTTMAGLCALVKRSEAVPMTIASGCDMFLFTKNIDEDIKFMKDGYKNGVITKERLNEAVCKILTLKASMGLHKKDENQTREPLKFPNYKYMKLSRECADKAITLVKEEMGVLPVDTEKYKKILFYSLENKTEGKGIFEDKESVNEKFCKCLRAQGFEVDVFTPYEGFEGMMQKTTDITEKYDLIIYSASIFTKSNQTVARIEWANPMGANVPIYTHSVPTIFVSFANPYHLLDVPMIKTYINCYCGYDTFITSLVDKLMGRDDFYGISPVDPFCGKWETKL